MRVVSCEFEYVLFPVVTMMVVYDFTYVPPKMKVARRFSGKLDVLCADKVYFTAADSQDTLSVR